MPLLKLGTITFELDTAAYKSLEYQSSWNWSSQERLGTTPDLHYTGKPADRIRLNGLILPKFKGSEGALDIMRSEADKVTPLLLVAGTGRVFGRFIIRSVNDKQSLIRKDGVPLRIEFSVELEKYDNL